MFSNPIPESTVFKSQLSNFSLRIGWKITQRVELKLWFGCWLLQTMILGFLCVFVFFFRLFYHLLWYCLMDALNLGFWVLGRWKFRILHGGCCVLSVMWWSFFLSTSEEDGFFFTGDALLDVGRTYWCLYWPCFSLFLVVWIRFCFLCVQMV